MQKVLAMTTREGHLRSEAVAWGAEDGDEAAPSWRVGHDGIGMIRSFRGFYSYGAPLLALGDGWSLLAPPTIQDDGTWEWWLVKDDLLHVSPRPAPSGSEAGR